VTKRAYKFRVYPTSAQQHNLAQTFGCCRFVYNWALSTRKRAYFNHGIKLSTGDLSAAITALKKQKGLHGSRASLACHYSSLFDTSTPRYRLPEFHSPAR
jgi:putative transposase